jgi:hypothetical protein
MKAYEVAELLGYSPASVNKVTNRSIAALRRLATQPNAAVSQRLRAPSARSSSDRSGVGEPPARA